MLLNTPHQGQSDNLTLALLWPLVGLASFLVIGMSYAIAVLVGMLMCAKRNGVNAIAHMYLCRAWLEPFFSINQFLLPGESITVF